MTPRLDTAVRAALAANDAIRAGWSSKATRTKGAGDYVTDVDLACERAIVDSLRASDPETPVVSEESGGELSDRYWLVDPLDGTTNFMHGFPIVGVSIALIEDGRPTIGVVHAPFLGETYTATAGGGAHRISSEGSVRLYVSKRDPSQAIIATGFPFRKKELLPRHLTAAERALHRFEDLRRPGAASLDLAWVAAGVFEGFFELNLSPWDVAAGALIVQEAGGIVTDWEGGPDYLSGDIVAAAPEVHAALIEITSSS